MCKQKKKPLVSIIVPVYNVEKYLSQCVDSILCQTLEDIEVILVDDGSTDNSGNICDTYIHDSRVKVIHKEHGGVSDTRNVGVAAAQADNIGFVDSDDYIDNDMYELLYNNMIEYDTDLSCCGFYDVYTNITRPDYSSPEKIITTDAKGAIELVMRGQNATLHIVNKLFKKSLASKHPFWVGKTFEDAQFIIPYLSGISKAVFDITPKYYYVHREGTITTKPYQKIDFCVIDAHVSNRELVRKKYPDLLCYADFRVFWALFYVLDKMISSDSYGDGDDYQDVVTRIKKEYFPIMKNPYIGKARKIAATGLMVHKSLYTLCLRIYIKHRKQLVKE